jgi:hypothetical protein
LWERTGRRRRSFFIKLLGFLLRCRHVLVLDPFSGEHTALLLKRREVVAGLWRHGYRTIRTAGSMRCSIAALLV